MASYFPPIEDITEFNSSLFTNEIEPISQGQANLLYLSKVNSDTSTAPLTTFNNAVTIGGATILKQTTITDGQNLNARQILSSNTGATIAHSLFTNMGTSSTLTIGSSVSSVQINSDAVTNRTLTMKNNSSCELTFSVNTIALQVTTGTKNFWTAAAGTTTINMGNILAPLNLNASTFTIAGTTAVFNSGVTCNNGLTANGVTAGDYDTQNTTTLCRICNSTTSGTIRLGAGLNSLGNIEIGSNTGNNTIKGLTTFTQTASFSVIPNCSILANANNQLVNWQTLNGQGFTTLPLVQSNNNIFTGTNQFNQQIKIQYAAAQYTELNQTAQSFKILNKSTGGNIQFECRTIGLIDTEVATFNTTGITLGINTGNNSIFGNTTFNHNVSITGNLTAGNLSQINTISGNTTFNQNLSVSGTSRITGLLTASSGLKTGDITPNISSAQNNIYTSLGIGGSIFFGTASRTMNIYGAVNMANTCQFSNALQTNDITHIGTQSNTAKNIYTGLTTGGSLTIGATTANTTTNIRGGAINIGGSANILTIDSPTTFNNLLKSDDITAITTTATHSIYTTLTSSGTINMGNNTSGTITNIKGGEINIGTYGSNINIKSPLNIVESYYGTTPTKITTIQQEGNSCRFTNNGSTNGNFIFEINETGTFNPLVINKTSIDIAGDANVEGNLLLYDTSSSGNYITLQLVGNNFIFNSAITTTGTTLNTTYNFKTNDNVGVTTTPLSISSNDITINTNITHNQAQLLNKVKVISGTSATLSLPLEQTLMFSSTGATNITITMPELNQSKHAGFMFRLIKTGSNTNSVVFNRAGSNLLRGYGSITGATTLTSMINTDTIINVYTLEVSAGNFEWIFY